MLNRKSIVVSLFLFSAVFSQSQLKLVLPTGNKGNVIDLHFHPNESQIIARDSYNQVVLWDVKQKQQYDSYFFNGYVSGADYVNDSVIAISYANNISYWNSKKHESLNAFAQNEKINHAKVVNGTTYWISNGIYKNKYPSDEIVKIVDFQDHCLDFFITNDEQYALVQTFDKLYVFNLKSKSVTHEIEVSSQSMAMDTKQNTLVVSDDKGALTVYNIEDGKLSKKDNLITDRMRKDFEAILIQDQIAWLGGENNTLSQYDLTKKKVLKNKKSSAGAVHAITYQEKNNLMAIGCESGVVQVLSAKTLRPIHTFRQVSANINTILPLKDSVTLLLGYNDGKVKKWNLKTHEVQTIAMPQKKLDPIFNRKYRVVGLTPEKAVVERYKYNQDQDKSKSKYYELYWSDGFQLESLDQLKSYIQKEQKIQALHEAYIYDLQLKTSVYAVNDDMIYASGQDGFLYFFKNDGGEYPLQLKAYSSGENDFFYAAPDHYYFASKDALHNVGALYNGKLLGFEQVDVIYNRPDKIISKFNYANDAYVQLLEKAYEKRIAKLNIETNQEGQITFESLPEIQTNLEDLPIESESPNLMVEVVSKAHGEVPLKALHVSVNGVPVFGKAGYLINQNTLHESFNIALSSGKNHIQVYVENEQGFKSYREEAYINYNQSYEPQLFVLSIGSNSFKNDAFNLNFAAKDALEFSDLMQKSPRYKDIKTIELTGEAVSKQAVLQSVEQLKKAQRDDVIMVFYAGHGILDASLNYYLSTYEMNFLHPEDNGLLFAELEDQLSKLQCRNKILFVDACHSGEIDKSEVAEMNSEEVVEGDIQFRAGLRNIKLNGDQSVFQLSKTLFADLRNNSGVITISSAGADEFALEGEKWNNGAFTYGILEGLSDRKADYNGDKKITSSELKKYLVEQIPIMTNGVQTPTTRVEVLEKDIRLW